MPRALALFALVLVGCGDRTPQGPVRAPQAKAPVAAVVSATVAVIDTSVPEEPVGGEVAAQPVAEPVVDNATAPAAVRSLRSAFEKQDLAALARLISAKPSLDTDNLARAEREFLLFGQPRVWSKVLPKLDTNKLDELDPRLPRVTLRVEVGGALGERTFTFERSDRGWFLVLS